MNEQENKENQNTQENIEKQSTKTWTQSEVDRHTAELIKRELSKFNDYDNIKKEYEDLKKKDDERILNTKSEAEKLMIEIEKLKNENQNLNDFRQKYEMQSVKSNVWGNPKYAALPKAYKNMIISSLKEEEIIESADKALEEYKKDFAGNSSASFGVPTIKKEVTINHPTEILKPSDMSNVLRSKIASMLKK
jgi:hypothetical protein